MDSTGLTTLMDAWLEAERDGWEFCVRAASAPVRRVIELAGVERLLGSA
jgi:anti-anti-sigma regulatory factor